MKVSTFIAVAVVACGCAKPADTPTSSDRDASASPASPFASVASTIPADASTVTGIEDAGRETGIVFERGRDAGPGTTPLPAEPWYHDRAEVVEECVAPLPSVPKPHFPEPFEHCDPRAEIFNPTRSSAHFHYREFSVDHTVTRRKTAPTECCYLIDEFPRREH